MKRKTIVKKTVNEMESKGYKWGKIRIETNDKNTIAEIECWHNDVEYIVFKK